MSEYSDFYWKHNDCLNKDTPLAHGFGEEVWNHQQAKIDELQARIDEAIERSGHAHIGYPMLSRQFDDVLKILKGNKDEK